MTDLYLLETSQEHEITTHLFQCLTLTCKQDPPEAEMQSRVTSRGDIDKWSKLAETSKHWQVFWWPRIRSRDSASFFLVTAMPCIILQISGVVSDMLYTTWGLKLFSGINFQIVHNCDKNAD